MVNWWRPLPARSARLPADTLTTTPLPGLDSHWSRLVTTQSSDGEHIFHVLDTGPVLEARGIRPTGTILAVHGNPTWSYLWRGVLEASVEQAGPHAAWRVIAPDQLDMGFSDRLAHPEPPSPEASSYRRFGQRLDDLDALGEALNIDTDQPVVTLGHDWGGTISLAWAVRNSAVVDAVVTLNTAVDHPVQESVPPALRAAMAPGVLPSSTVLSDAFLRVTLGLAEGGLPQEVAAAYRAPYVSRYGRGGIGGFVADIPAAADHASRPVLDEYSAGLRRWNKPALLMWGPKDPVFRDRYLHDLMDRLPEADLHRFEGAGHLLAEDRDIAKVLFTWLGDTFHTTAADSAASAPAAEASTGLHQQLEQMAVSWRRDSPAVVQLAADGTDQLTWAQLKSQVDSLATGFYEQGMRSGDRVSLLVQPGNQLTAILYACLRLGAVAVVADAGLGLKGMTRAVRSAWPDWVIGEKPGLAVARALHWPGRRISVQALGPRTARLVRAEASVERLLRRGTSHALQEIPVPGPEAAAAILFTSGSTGPAKGVIYTHSRLGALVALLRRTFAVHPGSSLIAGFAPFALLGPAIGATSVTPDMTVTKPATLTARAVASAAAAGEATMFFGSPAALANVVATSEELTAEQTAALRRIRLVLSAGAPVPVELLDQVQQLFPEAELHTPYGMTEGLLQTDITRERIHTAKETQQHGVCVGQPVEGVEFAVAPLDELGRAAEDLSDPDNAPGVLSEIVVSAAHLKAGYDRLWLTDRESRRDRHRGLLWHRTGDIGHFDTSGRLWIQGRLHHVITTPAGPIGPGVVETAVDALTEVSRSAAVGVGPRGTQAVVVILEPAPGCSLSVGASPLAVPEVSRAVRNAVGDVVVAAVLVVDSLPTDIRHNSKIDRTALAAWAEAVLAGERAAAP
ncbi:alpha/beta fold hydrolase [Nesterenkonia sphaerica]|uniref:Alpha/beta fold hydrolase n=1 Tax=Nesterenkonia sphaerica TaxID=1804988 RepID=A0A5R9AKZ6_9MICC|nr:alpha/beta fold hydrolase [Nesterenkonia sphaerica]TLP79482.1 alpha/beta fold hydrolase [Nesterenkonia sphaerica]